MILSSTSGRYVAISYPTTTFNDLEWFLKQENCTLDRIDPDNFLKNGVEKNDQVINLVTRDINTRRQVSNEIDRQQINRFSYIHPSSVITTPDPAPGAFLYPFVGIMSNTILGNDVLFNGHNGVGHSTIIRQGCIINGFVMIAGGVQIGDFCVIHSGVTVYDQIKICPNVTVSARSIVRKNINESGTYATVKSNVFKKIANRCS